MKFEALLVIDVQHIFMRNQADRVIEPIRDLVEKLPADKVYYLRYINHPDSLYTRHLDCHAGMTKSDTDVVPEAYRDNAPVFNHYGYAPSVELMQILQKYKTVGICGVDTDACVMAAVFALWDAGIRPLVLADYCASSGGKQFHETALGLMLRQFGVDGVIHGRF